MFMGDFWREAGLFAIPIAILGGITLWLAIRYVRGRSAQPGPTLALIAATLMTGMLGTVMGFQMSLEFLGTLAPERRFIIGIGAKEALNDTVLALMFCLPATLLLAFGGAGARRGAARTPERDEDLERLPA